MKIVKMVELTPKEKEVCKESMIKILEIKTDICFKMNCKGLDCIDCPIHKAARAIEEGALMLNIE